MVLFTVSNSYIYENDFMGRLLSPPLKYGTYCGLCVYPMRGENFVRKASSLTAERVKTAPEFKPTMAWANRLKAASRLGSAVYAMLAPSRRKHKLYRTLTGQAMRLLREGKSEGEIVVELMLSIRLKKKKSTAPPAAQQETAPAIRRQRKPIRSHNTHQKAMQRIGRTRSLHHPYPFLPGCASTGHVPEVIGYAPG